MIARHLLKLKHTLEDQEGHRIGLHYLRDMDKREVDFLISVENKPWFIVECKFSKTTISKHLNYFADRIEVPWKYHVVMDDDIDLQNGKSRIISANKFLCALP